MASMASPTTCLYRMDHHKYRRKIAPRISASIPETSDDKHPKLIGRREIILRSSELAMIGAIFQLSGKKPDYLGVQKNERLALCPATNNCISTSENISDRVHYAPPWNYNGGRRSPVKREVAMKELLNVINSVKPDKFTPRIVEKKDDYVHVEYDTDIALLLPLGTAYSVCGGPPCQGISGFNRFRNTEAPLEDPKHQQLLVFLDIIDFLKPKYVLMENVVDLLLFSKGFYNRRSTTFSISTYFGLRKSMMSKNTKSCWFLGSSSGASVFLKRLKPLIP